MTLRNEIDNDKYPQLIDSEINDDVITVQLYVPAKIVYFEGHFDSNPILPGVVQLDWALYYFNKLSQSEMQFGGADVIKYQQPILPDARVTLTLQWLPKVGKLTFKYLSDVGVHASGKLKLMGPNP
ncbi:3-hydroxyacyl-ACP dehydratase [Paraferrimonas sedimenticola]|uniref:3-hydroxyacyl-ACP dehydratase n=1 Tax=Paraferrimonas sedimenticola TaxID=375674 RepID=A0AA37W1N2_9GAMM|nr:3-hydroxyacyl-ACP dehydratase [Paraferrimonas sedimenticola]GLP97033.1 3-hydroxyacyl-ACP dehydratase [Paraferrimonas sedimenticola]